MILTGELAISVAYLIFGRSTRHAECLIKVLLLNRHGSRVEHGEEHWEHREHKEHEGYYACSLCSSCSSLLTSCLPHPQTLHPQHCLCRLWVSNRHRPHDR